MKEVRPGEIICREDELDILCRVFDTKEQTIQVPITVNQALVSKLTAVKHFVRKTVNDRPYEFFYYQQLDLVDVFAEFCSTKCPLRTGCSVEGKGSLQVKCAPKEVFMYLMRGELSEQ